MGKLLNELTRYLEAQSWQIAVLTITVAVVSFLLRNRSAHVRYLLWLIVDTYHNMYNFLPGRLSKSFKNTRISRILSPV